MNYVRIFGWFISTNGFLKIRGEGLVYQVPQAQLKFCCIFSSFASLARVWAHNILRPYLCWLKERFFAVFGCLWFSVFWFFSGSTGIFFNGSASSACEQTTKIWSHVYTLTKSCKSSALIKIQVYVLGILEENWSEYRNIFVYVHVQWVWIGLFEKLYLTLI